MVTGGLGGGGLGRRWVGNRWAGRRRIWTAYKARGETLLAGQRRKSVPIPRLSAPSPPVLLRRHPVDHPLGRSLPATWPGRPLQGQSMAGTRRGRWRSGEKVGAWTATGARAAGSWASVGWAAETWAAETWAAGTWAEALLAPSGQGARRRPNAEFADPRQFPKHAFFCRQSVAFASPPPTFQTCFPPLSRTTLSARSFAQRHETISDFPCPRHRAISQSHQSAACASPPPTSQTPFPSPPRFRGRPFSAQTHTHHQESS